MMPMHSICMARDDNLGIFIGLEYAIAEFIRVHSRYHVDVPFDKLDFRLRSRRTAIGQHLE